MKKKMKSALETGKLGQLGKFAQQIAGVTAI